MRAKEEIEVKNKARPSKIAVIAFFVVIISAVLCTTAMVFYQNGKKLLADEMVFVKGVTITIGNGVESAKYEFEVKDFKISPYEVTNDLFIKVYNKGLDWNVLTVADDQIRFHPDTGVLLQFALLDMTIAHCQVLHDAESGKLKCAAGTEQLPVVGVSWHGAAVFCNLLSRIEGCDQVYDTIDWVHKKKARGYRLPTYEEWEFAARGGASSKGYEYSGSDDPNECGWFLANSSGSVHPVGLKKPNELGLFDMSGNLHEFLTEIWCPLRTDYFKPDEDCFHSANRMWRGGAWNKQPVSVYFFRQSIDNPNYCLGFPDIGFRPVLDL